MNDLQARRDLADANSWTMPSGGAAADADTGDPAANALVAISRRHLMQGVAAVGIAAGAGLRLGTAARISDASRPLVPGGVNPFVAAAASGPQATATITVPVTAATANGDALTLLIESNAAGTIASVTDTKGNSYTARPSITSGSVYTFAYTATGTAKAPVDRAHH